MRNDLYIKMFCRFLKENDIYYSFKNNCHDFYILKYRYENKRHLHDIITNEIHWRDTVEGLSFWSKIHHKWIEHLYG